MPEGTRILRMFTGPRHGQDLQVPAEPALEARYLVPLPERPGYAAEYLLAVGPDGPRLVWEGLVALPVHRP